jgi:hypothetical protein
VRIEDFRSSTDDGVATFIATVHWEDRQREPVDVFYAVDEKDARRVSLNHDAFRIPAAVVAMRDHETRLTGGDPMCPALQNGLASSLAWLSRWADSDVVPPAIDLAHGCVHPEPQAGSAAAFFSGGIDSSALLAANHDAYEIGHPLRITVGLVVVGIQSHRWMDRTAISDQLAAARDELSAVGSEAGIEVVPIATNVRALNDGGTFWKYEYQGAALAGIGHLFAQSISNLSIAGTWEIGYLDNWGSHPLLDPGYGSHSLRVWHELAQVGRLERTRLVATSSGLLKGLNVCNKWEAGDQNCGRCEKCLRTMLGLEALGLLTAAPTFDRTRVEPGDLRQIRILDRGLEGEYLELIQPLNAVGRPDLAVAVERAVRRGRLLRRPSVHRVRAWGSRVLPRDVRERVFRMKSLPR